MLQYIVIVDDTKTKQKGLDKTVRGQSAICKDVHFRDIRNGGFAPKMAKKMKAVSCYNTVHNTKEPKFTHFLECRPPMLHHKW